MDLMSCQEELSVIPCSKARGGRIIINLWQKALHGITHEMKDLIFLNPSC